MTRSTGWKAVHSNMSRLEKEVDVRTTLTGSASRKALAYEQPSAFADIVAFEHWPRIVVTDLENAHDDLVVLVPSKGHVVQQ